MRYISLIGVAVPVLFLLAGTSLGQVDEMCREYGAIPSFDSPFAQVPYVFGRVTLKGVEAGAKPPKVTIALISSQPQSRVTVEPSGNYCFKRSGNGATLLVEVGGIEATRRTLPAVGPAQQREDFEITITGGPQLSTPAVVSARFSHPKNEKTAELYKKAGESQAAKEPDKTISYLKEIVSIDPADFVAWAQLGTMYFEQSSFPEAEAAFRKSIELKPEYTPAWINAGKLRAAQKQYVAAIEVFKHAAELEPKNARVFQLLGETYLQAKMGTLGVDALNKAIELDPVGMAELHLTIARLYDLAGAKPLAAEEYKMLLEKVPTYPDRKKLEKYIKDNRP